MMIVTFVFSKTFLFISCLYGLYRESLQQQKDALLRKLMEPEVYRAIAAHQVSAVQKSVSKLCTIGRSVSTNLSLVFICPVRFSLLQKK